MRKINYKHNVHSPCKIYGAQNISLGTRSYVKLELFHYQFVIKKCFLESYLKPQDEILSQDYKLFQFILLIGGMWRWV